MKILYKLVRSKKQKGRLFSAFLSFLFFIGMVGLYSGLGTFVSSCGSGNLGSPVAINISLFNYNAFCSPVPYLNYIDFQSSVASGWRIKVKVDAGSSTYSVYDFGPSLTAGSATISNQLIKGVNVPSEANYRITVSMVSLCNCPYIGDYYYYEFSKNYAANTIPGAVLGHLGSPIAQSCQ